MIKVSDHAVVRYLERRLGVDIEAVRQAIAGSLDSRLVEFSGGAACKISADGMSYWIRRNTVTTCVVRKAWTEKRNHRGRIARSGRRDKRGLSEEV